jgi:hypothetical protein
MLTTARLSAYLLTVTTRLLILLPIKLIISTDSFTTQMLMTEYEYNLILIMTHFQYHQLTPTVMCDISTTTIS